MSSDVQPGRRPAPRRPAPRRPAPSGARRVLAALVFTLGFVVLSPSLTPVHGQNLRDQFADRQLLTSANGRISGNNSGATLEPGEPRHGGKPGGHSLWISWIAPADGVIRFKTEGSDFDTLLSAYSAPATNEFTVADLIELARADDSDGLEDESEVKFGVLAGSQCEIAVDGYYGASGPLKLTWDFEPTTVPPPIIISSPGDRAVSLGDSVTLTVVLTNIENGDLRWYHNGQGLSEFGPTLEIPSVQASDVGQYRLRVSIDGPDYFSVPAEIQINSDGAWTALARDKLLDAFESALIGTGGGGGTGAGPGVGAMAGGGGGGGGAGVTRGYTGTQIFNTSYAVRDPAEPAHCGLNGGASFWYAYTPPTDGTLQLDTIGSGYDTYLSVYTYDPPLSGYGGLLGIACDNDGANTNGAAWLELAAPRSRQFLIVVDGIDGARGLARLNYRLDTNRPPAPPTLLEAPLPRAVATGASVVLQPLITGSAPLHFRWRHGEEILPGATNSSLVLTNLDPSGAGEYVATVSSHVGAPLDVRLPLRVLIPPEIRLLTLLDGSTVVAFSNIAGQRFLLEHTASLDLPWLPLGEPGLLEGDEAFITNAPAGPTGFYRLRVE